MGTPTMRYFDKIICCFKKIDVTLQCNQMTNTMTKELLNKVATMKKINLSLFDHVYAKVNDNFTFVEITFFNLQVSPMGDRKWCNIKNVKLSVSSILKREEEFPDEYETDGSQWIYEII